MNQNPAQLPVPTPAQAAALIALYRALSPEQRTQILEVLNG